MATITEASVRVVLRVYADADGLHVDAVARSLTVDGAEVRRLSVDIADQLSAARRQGASDLLADVEQRLKVLWDIA